MHLQLISARDQQIRARFLRKFPADSLFIREFDLEQSSILTAHTASRSRSPRRQRATSFSHPQDIRAGRKCRLVCLGVSVAGSAAIPYSRSRCRLWWGVHQAARGDGHTRSSDGAAVTLECVGRAADRFDPEKVSRPCRGHRRGSSAPDPAVLCRFLSSRTGASLFEKGLFEPLGGGDAARASVRRGAPKTARPSGRGQFVSAS